MTTSSGAQHPHLRLLESSKTYSPGQILISGDDWYGHRNKAEETVQEPEGERRTHMYVPTADSARVHPGRHRSMVACCRSLENVYNMVW